jgi:lytic murein transglycosylase
MLFCAPAAMGLEAPAAAQVVNSTQLPPRQDTASWHSAFEAYKTYLAQRAAAEGIRPATISSSVPALRLNMRAIELDRAQSPGPVTGAASSARSPALQPYLRQHVSSSLIWRGQSRYYSLWPRLVQIQQRYGVDAATLLAIYGKETSYGSYTGTFDLLEALASLAFEGRRRPMFEMEFLATLKLVDAGVSRTTLRGSYAGATGLPQFMPSVVLRLRVDGDGDGYADIWNNEVDALASIANYLKDAGWKAGVPWGAAAIVPATLDRRMISRPQDEPRCPVVYRRHSRMMTIAEWRTLGVLPSTPLRQEELASLIEPEGPGEKPYLLTGNYQAILNYNCSNYYALSVSLLSDAIARR